VAAQTRSQLLLPFMFLALSAKHIISLPEIMVISPGRNEGRKKEKEKPKISEAVTIENSR